MIFGYTHKQLTSITSALNMVEVKGRQNCKLVESIFEILENGVNIDIKDEEEIEVE